MGQQSKPDERIPAPDMVAKIRNWLDSVDRDQWSRIEWALHDALSEIIT